MSERNDGDVAPQLIEAVAHLKALGWDITSPGAGRFGCSKDGSYAEHDGEGLLCLAQIYRWEPKSAARPTTSETYLPDGADEYEARVCPGMPADCCDYGVISHKTGREVCRVWLESDARLIAELLNSRAALTDARELRAYLAKLLPVGSATAPGDRVQAFYIRMDELRRLRTMALLEAPSPSTRAGPTDLS